MLEFINYKDFFNKSAEKQKAIQKEQIAFSFKVDKKVTKYLGTSETYLIAIIYNVLQLHDYAQQKKTRDQYLTEEEKNLIEDFNKMEIQEIILPKDHSQKYSNTRNREPVCV